MFARYWRIRCAAVQSGTNFALAEVELRATGGGADQTGSGTAIASSFYAESPPANAFDNDNATIWSGPFSGPMNQWIGYDFGTDVEVLELVMTATPLGSQAPSVFIVEQSADGVDWGTVKGYITTGWTGGSSQTFAVPSTPEADGPPAWAYAAGVQIAKTPIDPPAQVYAAGVQLVRRVVPPPPTTTGRRRQLMIVT